MRSSKQSITQVLVKEGHFVQKIDTILIQIDEVWHQMTPRLTDDWCFQDVEVNTGSNNITLAAPKSKVSRLHIVWRHTFPQHSLYMGDCFERGYGNLGFSALNADALYDWYFCVVQPQGSISCWGVAIRPNAWCSWTIAPKSVDLWLDVRNGNHPLELGSRKLRVCELVINEYSTSSFDAVRSHCLAMAKKNAAETFCPMVGLNDWYFAYGNNTELQILNSAEFISSIWPWKNNEHARPYIVIDDGWEIDYSPTYNGGPWNGSNSKFGDMAVLAQQLKRRGIHPGIWFRPLLTSEDVDPQWVLHHNEDGTNVLDISHPEVIQRVQHDVQRFVEWGFEVIKHDFTTFDVLNCWGNDIDLSYQHGEVNFWNTEKTSAEIFNDFYRAIREAAGDATLIGCDTISHLSAGIFDVMRIGDDTSGIDFNRTRRTGVNSLAFRIPQHNIFYQCDADCIGITADIPWQENKEWLRLLAYSGTPLFISCDPEQIDSVQRNDISNAISIALTRSGTIQPIDWEHSRYPQTWKAQEGVITCEWYPYPRNFPLSS